MVVVAFEGADEGVVDVGVVAVGGVAVGAGALQKIIDGVATVVDIGRIIIALVAREPEAR